MGKASRGKAQARALREELRRRHQAQEQARERASVLFEAALEAPLTVVVDTPLGVMARRMPAALPRPVDVEPGIGAEEATHTAAATWGLPDFVFRAPVRKLASGVRELGDRLVIVGERAAVVQVKSRQGELRDTTGEQSWVRKNAVKAAKQAKGTVRLLRAEPAAFVNARGREVVVDGSTLEWVAVVIIDHDNLPDDTTVDLALGQLPVVALLRRDWDFLFHQLRSTHAVVDYLFRVACLPARALGEEPVRYYELAAADLATAPSPVDADWLGLGVQSRSTPQLPQAPAGSNQRDAHILVRVLMEEIATSPLPGDADEAIRLQALADIDSLPVGLRGEFGQYLQGMLSDVASVTAGLKWRFRRLLDGATMQLIFGVCSSEYDTRIAAAARSYVELRHHQFEQAHGDSDGRVTLLVLLTPRRDGQRPFDTTMFRMAGRSTLTQPELTRWKALWDTGSASSG